VVVVGSKQTGNEYDTGMRLLGGTAFWVVYRKGEQGVMF
jgi:hypothetical protein